MFLPVRYLLYDMFITNECRLNIIVRGTGRAWDWFMATAAPTCLRLVPSFVCAT